MPTRMTALMKPIIQRKLPETKVPITAPVVLRAGMFAKTVLVATIKVMMKATTTTVECPRENHMPTVMGRFPSCISFLVVLSMAAIWCLANQFCA